MERFSRRFPLIFAIQNQHTRMRRFIYGLDLATPCHIRLTD